MKKTIFAFILLIMAFGCNEVQEINPSLQNSYLDQSQVSVQQLPLVENGILKFKSQENLDFWISSRKNLLELGVYLKRKDFRSLEDLFSQLVDIENKASDSLTAVFEKTKIMPNRINSEYPIHSKEIEPYLSLLYFYPEGGFIPFGSIIRPGIENVLNEDAKVYVSNDLYDYNSQKVSINGHVPKTNYLLNSIITPTEYIERHQNTVGNYRTITDISYVVQSRSWYGSTTIKEYTVVGTILLRNFRNGLFGWNTRKTTSLRIAGELNYGLSVCPDPYTYTSTQPFYNISVDNNNYLLTSNGSSTTSIQSTFTIPTNNLWYYDQACSNSTIKFAYRIYHNLTITGENNNVSNFTGGVGWL